VFGAVVLAACVWPSEALAWGPLAHLSFTSSALADLSGASHATQVLLSRFPGEFLYGSLAADIIVGKNLARYAVHCHNWMVGFTVLDRAQTDATRAFSLGFLAHLAADTVAHNYYVPYKTVEGYRVRACGHAYWELRFDQKLPRDLWRLARQVSTAEYREHDEHLEECLADTQVIPFSISKKMFGSMLLAARLKKWQVMSQVVAGERDLHLSDDEVRDCQALAVSQISGMLRAGASATCAGADPTGGRNLHAAVQMRTALRERRDLTAEGANRLVERARPAFRHAIHGRLDLPELPDPAEA
jgi:hypothetical protein